MEKMIIEKKWDGKTDTKNRKAVVQNAQPLSCFFEKNRLRILHNADSQTVLVIHKFHLQLL